MGGRDEEKKYRIQYSTIKPLSTISVPCMKIRGGGEGRGPPADAHVFIQRIFMF